MLQEKKKIYIRFIRIRLRYLWRRALITAFAEKYRRKQSKFQLEYVETCRYKNRVPVANLYGMNKTKILSLFDVHRVVHRNIISVVKPTRCTKVSFIFLFGMTIYTFRTVFLSIVRSSRLCIQQQAFVKQILPSSCWQAESNVIQNKKK